jgi:trans-aconitate methyltransferase
MIKQARNNLQLFDNVEIVQSSFTDIRLPRKLDVIFSNSALHWVQDHRKAFQIFWEMLRPMNSKYTTISSNSASTSSTGSSQLLIQCGGYGNLQQIIALLERITHLDQFKAYFTDWKQSWHFARPDDTNKLLEETGYVNTTVYSNSDRVILPNRHIYSKFVKTVVMKPSLERLSPDNDDSKLKTVFLELFLDEVEKRILVLIGLSHNCLFCIKSEELCLKDAIRFTNVYCNRTQVDLAIALSDLLDRWAHWFFHFLTYHQTNQGDSEYETEF